MPTLLNQRRTLLLAGLIANGLAQAGLAIGMAVLMEATLRSLSGHGGSWPDLTTTVGLAVAALGLIALRAWQRRDSEAFGLSYVQDVRIETFRHVCMLPMSAKSPALGPVLTRLTNDLLAVKNWISYGLVGGIVAIATVSVSLAYLAHLNLMLAFASALSVALVFGFTAIVVPQLKRSVRSARRARGRLAKELGAKIPARSTIQALGRVDKEVARLREISQDLTNNLVTRGLHSGLLRALPFAVLPLAVLLLPVVSIFSSSLAANGGHRTLGPSDVVTWLFVMSLAIAQLQEAARALDYRVNFGPAVKRIRSTFMISSLATGGPVSESSPTAAGISISLSPDADGRGGCSVRLDLAPSDCAYLVGGVAETRADILRSVARLDRAPGVRVEFGGVDVATLPLSRVRKEVALISADLPILPGTFGGNLRKAAGRKLETAEIAHILATSELLSPDLNLQELMDAQTTRSSVLGLPGLAAKARLAIGLARRPKVLLIEDPELLAQPSLVARLAADCKSRGAVLLLADGEGAISIPHWRALDITSSEARTRAVRQQLR